MLNTRFGWAAKVRKVLASAAEGAVKVRSLLFTCIPSAVASGPPVKVKLVLVATSELHGPRAHTPTAEGSKLKTTLLSVAVTVPVDPVSNVPITVAEAFGTKSKLPTAAIPR